MTTSAEFYPLSSDGFTVVSRQRYRPHEKTKLLPTQTTSCLNTIRDYLASDAEGNIDAEFHAAKAAEFHADQAGASAGIILR